MNNFIKDQITYYVLERWTGGVWTPDVNGHEYDDLKEAKQELAFNRKLFPQEKFRLVKKTATVIWRRA